MCCGHAPFGGDTEIATAMARLTTTPPSMRAERAEVPPPLDDLVHRCLARDPAKRFASAAAVRHALDIVSGAVAPVAKPRPAAARPTTPAPRAPAVPAAAPTPVAPRRKRRGSGLWLVLVFIVAAAAGVAAYLLVRNETTGSSGSGSGSGTAASQSSGTVSDFDPFGDDGFEDPSFPVEFTDGDLTATWSTPQYDDFSEKPGVGLRFDLDDTYTVAAVTVDATQAGWGAEIYVSAAEGTTLTDLRDWGDPVVTGSDLDPSHEFSLASAPSARSVLLWFTELPPASAGARQSLTVTGVELA
jgi:hypothetical protein